jgi:hypothetical protein
MSEIDRQTDKTTRWAFTAYEDQWDLFKEIPSIVSEWMWQIEICPNTGRKHYQGCIKTRTQQRHSAMRKLLPGVHIEVSRNWDALVNYCKKKETSVENTFQQHVNTRKYLKFHEALIRVANAYVDEYANVVNEMKTLAFDEAIAVANANTDADKADTRAYQKAVEQLCYQNPEDISLYSNPQLIRAWKMCRGLWLRMSHCSHDLCSPGCECSDYQSVEDARRESEREAIARDFFNSYSIDVDAS